MDRRSFLLGTAATAVSTVVRPVPPPPPTDADRIVKAANLGIVSRDEAARTMGLNDVPAPPQLLAPLLTQGFLGLRWIPKDPLGDPFHIYLETWAFDEHVAYGEERHIRTGSGRPGELCFDLTVPPPPPQITIKMTVATETAARMGSRGALRVTREHHRTEVADGEYHDLRVDGTIWEGLYHDLHLTNTAPAGKRGQWVSVHDLTFIALETARGHDPFGDAPVADWIEGDHGLGVAYSGWTGETDTITL